MTNDLPEDFETFIRDPQNFPKAIALLKAMRKISVDITPPQSANAPANSKPIIVGDPPALTLALPIKAPTPIANPSADTASNTAAIIAILQWMRGAGLQ